MSIYAQEVEQSLFKIDFLLPGVTYEKKLSKYSTALINPMLGFSYGWNNESNYYSITPNINFQYRHYCNFERRTKLSKNTSYNSANFIAPRLILVFPSVFSNYDDQSKFGLVLGGVYGLQRTYKSGVYILGEAGLGYGETIVPILSFKVGYAFKNKSIN